MSIRTPSSDATFNCEECGKEYQIKTLNVSEEGESMHYSCPTCDKVLYTTHQ